MADEQVDQRPPEASQVSTDANEIAANKPFPTATAETDDIPKNPFLVTAEVPKPTLQELGREAREGLNPTEEEIAEIEQQIAEREQRIAAGRAILKDIDVMRNEAVSVEE